MRGSSPGGQHRTDAERANEMSRMSAKADQADGKDGAQQALADDEGVLRPSATMGSARSPAGPRSAPS